MKYKNNEHNRLVISEVIQTLTDILADPDTPDVTDFEREVFKDLGFSKEDLKGVRNNG